MASLRHPPLSKVDYLVEPARGISQLAFMNQQPRVYVAAFDGVHDLIEWNDHRLHVAQTQPQRKICRSHQSRHGDRRAAKLAGAHRHARDHQRAVVIAHRSSRRQQGVLIEHVCVRVNRNRGHVKLGVHRTAVKRLDVLNDVAES